MGFCMVATLAWTRLDFAMPGCIFLGGTKLVWTATEKRVKDKFRVSSWPQLEKLTIFFFCREFKSTDCSWLALSGSVTEHGRCEDRWRNQKNIFFFSLLF